MLRVEVSEEGGAALPAIDVGDASFVIGSGPEARVRMPATVAQPEHVVVASGRWRDVVAGRDGEIGDGITLEVGTYRVRVAPAPPGVAPSPPQRTESLARELMRGLLGDGAAPSLEVERGPVIGAAKKLAPPESVLVIGRGDEASWILLDEDLSRTHAEIRRGWDGTRVFDLGSKNGTRVDGVTVGTGGLALRDGALLELGKVALRYRDAADRQLGVSTPVAAPPPASSSFGVEQRGPQPASSSTTANRSPPPPARADKPGTRPSAVPFYAALVITIAALVGLVWVLSL